MEAQEKKKRTTDEVIAYLLQSKKEMQEEIKRDVYTLEFQMALKKLRNKNIMTEYNKLIDLAEQGKVTKDVSQIKGDIFVRKPESTTSEIVKNGEWTIEKFFLDKEWIAERNILTLENGEIYEDVFKVFEGFNKL